MITPIQKYMYKNFYIECDPEGWVDYDRHMPSIKPGEIEIILTPKNGNGSDIIRQADLKILAEFERKRVSQYTHFEMDIKQVNDEKDILEDYRPIKWKLKG